MRGGRKAEKVRDQCLANVFAARTECALHFEALGPDREKVFYHCDQLIKTMYGTFARGWVEAFGAANVLFLRTEDDVFVKRDGPPTAR